jgi:uncharacterized protein DUF4823
MGEEEEMKRGSLAILLLFAGCAEAIHATHGGGGFAAPGFKLGGGQVLVGKIPDGSGADGIIAGSGDLMTQAVRRELLKGGLQILATDKSTSEDLLTEAAAKSVPFVIVGRIPRWEDNATQWSKKLDYSSLNLEIYRTSDKTLVASSDRNVQGTTVPDDWAGWLAAAGVADLLGKEPPLWNETLVEIPAARRGW